MSSKNLSLKEQMRGFPVGQFIVLSIVRFSEPIAFTSMFPYIYFLIRDFGIAGDEANIAKYSGYLSASFALFQFFFCVRWAAVSDKIGRKPVLMMGMTGTLVSMVMFGFSQNFWFALFSRSFMGAFNGNIGVIRTAVGEVATERRHQGVAFAMIPLLWNVGAVIGPMIGGSKYLTRPRGSDIDEPSSFMLKLVTMSVPESLKRSDNLYNRFLDKYPYALSNLVVASIVFFNITCAFLFLEESHKSYKNRRDIGLEIGDKLRVLFGFERPIRPWMSKYNQITEESPIYTAQTSYATEEDIFVAQEEQLAETLQTGHLRKMDLEISTHVSESTNSSDSSNDTIFTPEVVKTIIANFLFALQNILYGEFLPVLLAGTFVKEGLRFPDRIKGGFGYETSEIGKLLSTTGLVGSLSIIFLFPYIDRRFKTLHTFRVSSLVFPPLYLILPYLVFTLSDYNPNYPSWLTKALLYLLASIQTMSGSIGFPSVIMLTHRATKEEHRSYVNSQNISLASLARCLGPIGFGYLMTLSESYGVVQAPWIFLAIVAAGCAVQPFYMTDHDEDSQELE